VETRRGRKLRAGDSVLVNGEEFVIASDEEPGDDDQSEDPSLVV
jgi:hypothetical protein